MHHLSPILFIQPNISDHILYRNTFILQILIKMFYHQIYLAEYEYNRDQTSTMGHFLDKKIKAVKKANDKKMDALVKLDIPRDRKIAKCDKMMGKKK